MGKPRSADAVGLACRDDSGDVGAVAVVVGHVRAEVEHVGAADVVDDAVCVVVAAVACDLAGFVQTAPARSGWSSWTPVSSTATRTPAPLDCVHASPAPMAGAASAHYWASRGSGAAAATEGAARAIHRIVQIT